MASTNRKKLGKFYVSSRQTSCFHVFNNVPVEGKTTSTGSSSLSRAYSRHWDVGAIFLGTFSEKRLFCLLAPPKQMSFLTISNENIFLKTQSTRLVAIVAPNKGLE